MLFRLRRVIFTFCLLDMKPILIVIDFSTFICVQRDLFSKARADELKKRREVRQDHTSNQPVIILQKLRKIVSILQNILGVGNFVSVISIQLTIEYP